MKGAAVKPPVSPYYAEEHEAFRATMRGFVRDLATRQMEW